MWLNYLPLFLSSFWSLAEYLLLCTSSCQILPRFAVTVILLLFFLFRNTRLYFHVFHWFGEKKSKESKDSNVLLDPYEYHIDLCNESCSSGRPVGRPSCVAKVSILDITCKLFNHFCRHYWLLHRFHWPWPYLRATGSKQNLLASLSRTLFVWSGWKLMWRWSNSSWTSWDLFLSRVFLKNKVTNCCFTDCVK